MEEAALEAVAPEAGVLAAVAGGAGAGGLGAAEPAQAVGPVSVGLSKFRSEPVACPKGIKAFGGFNNVLCLKVSAEAQNPSQNDLVNVDVFGRVDDAVGDNALDQEEASDSGRISSIRKVARGKSQVKFDLFVSRQGAEKGDLVYRQLRGVAYPGAGLTFEPITEADFAEEE